MSWLSSWMRDVIMIVLLATFVDMILPSRSMERYVKLVLSLLILFALLHPIIALLTDQPTARLTTAMNLVNPGGSNENSLQQILADASKMREQHESQSLQLAAEEVAKQMSQQIRDSTGEYVKEIKVSLGLNESQTGTWQRMSGDAAKAAGEPYISKVQVVLQEAVESSSEQVEQVDSPSDIHIPNVEPVHIDVQLEASQEVMSSAEPVPKEDLNTEKVKQLLGTQWGLLQGQIEVHRYHEESL